MDPCPTTPNAGRSGVAPALTVCPPTYPPVPTPMPTPICSGTGNASVNVVAGGKSIECGPGGGGGGGSQTPTSKILNAAKNFIGTNTRNLKSAPYRNECVAAVQAILDAAGLAEIANGTLGVPQFENALSTSGYSQTTTPTAGDFVVLGSQDHVGVYLGNGQMVSNSSTQGTFSWQDTVTAQNAVYGSGGPHYWHHG